MRLLNTYAAGRVADPDPISEEKSGSGSDARLPDQVSGFDCPGRLNFSQIKRILDSIPHIVVVKQLKIEKKNNYFASLCIHISL